MVTSSRVYQNRSGWILCWQEADRLYFGEAAPLPGFSPEDMQDVQHLIRQHIDRWTQLLKEPDPTLMLAQHYKEENLPATLQFALDSLAYQFKAKRNGTTFSKLLFKDSTPPFIAVNGLISLLDDEETLVNIQSLIKEGFQTIKCKVGQHFQEELEKLTQIRKAFPRLNIRLDANGAWKLPKAIDYLDALAQLNIQYCEEPLTNPTVKNIRSLSQKMNIPLALDEILNTTEQWPSLLSYTSVLVIKPMLIGSFNKLLDIKRKADNQNCALVLTSSLESSIGRGIVALLASGLGTENYAHGLNTGKMLGHDTVPNRPLIQHGQIDFGKQMLPLEADKNHLKNISISSITSS